MRILFERTGGFMGLRTASRIDTAVMPEKEAIELQHLIMAATAYFEKMEPLAAPATAPDTFQYRLVVGEEGEEREFKMTEETAPDEVRPLLRRLTLLARKYPDNPTE